MSVSDGPRRATFVRLPGDVQRPFQVFLNGVEQREGVDFVVRDGTLVFERTLAKEELGVGRWTSMVFGIAGYFLQAEPARKLPNLKNTKVVFVTADSSFASPGNPGGVAFLKQIGCGQPDNRRPPEAERP